jgi:hypothetical protein
VIDAEKHVSFHRNRLSLVFLDDEIFSDSFHSEKGSWVWNLLN